MSIVSLLCSSFFKKGDTIEPIFGLFACLRGSTVVDGDAFGKFDGVGESDFRNGLRLEGGQWVK